METPITCYQTCIKHLLSEYELLNTQDTEITLCFDDERMSYLVMRVGWFQQYKRIHRCLIHIEIVDETVVIQANNTEDLIDTDLIEMGIPKEKICLGFIPADFRAYAEQHSRKRQGIDTNNNSIEGRTMSPSSPQRADEMMPTMS